MNREMKMQEITEIFRTVLESPELCLDEDSNPDSIEEWDSYSQVVILAEIENFYHIKFQIFEMKKMNSVKNILDVLCERGL